MLNSRLARAGAWMVKELSRRKSISNYRAGYTQRINGQYLHPPWSSTRLGPGGMFQKPQYLSTVATNHTSEEGSEQKTISVTFVDKDGEEKQIKVPIGMSMLEAAHENDIELEGPLSGVPTCDGRPDPSHIKEVNILLNVFAGACEGSLACSTCHVIVMDVKHYNKLEDPTDEENDMLDLAFGLTETSRLGCQVIAKPELDGIRLAVPAATRNFAVDGFVPKPH